MLRSWSLLVLGLLGGTACAAPPAVRAVAFDRAPALSTVGEGTDWGAVLFPDGARTAATPVASAPAAVEPPAVAPPAVFGGSDLMVSDDSINVEHADVASFCKAQVGCFETALPVKFHPNGTFRSLHAVRVKTEGYAYTTLLVEVAGGVAPLQVSYDVDDPNDPGCPSIVRKVGIERVSVENGVLVVVALGVTTTWFEDGTARGVLVPVVSIAKAGGEALHLRHFETMGGPDLGSIMQPSSGFVPWHKLAWKHRTPFSIEQDGTMKLLSKS